MEVRSLLESWGRPELTSAALRVMRREGVGTSDRLRLNKRDWTATLLRTAEVQAGSSDGSGAASVALQEFFARCEADVSTWQATVGGGGPGGLAQQQRERRDAEVLLRAELAALGLASLQRQADARGSPRASIDIALDSSSPKEALISLVVSAELDAVEAAAEEGVPPAADEHPPSAEEAEAALAALGLLDPPAAKGWNQVQTTARCLVCG